MLIGGGLEVGGVENFGTAGVAVTSSTNKPRLRSLTPSAEKLRVSTLLQQQQTKHPDSSMDPVREPTFPPIPKQFFHFFLSFELSFYLAASWVEKVGRARNCNFSIDFDRQPQISDKEDYGFSKF